MAFNSTGYASMGASQPKQYGNQAPAGYEMDGQGNYRQTPNTGANLGMDAAHIAPPNYADQFAHLALSGLAGAGAAPATPTPPSPSGGGAVGGGTLPFYGAGSPYTPPGGGSAPVSAPQHPNLPAQVNPASGPSADMLKANNDSVYARAKDEAGSTARAALTGLQGELQSRGFGGAGYEAGQIGSTLSREANTIGEASRQNAQTQYDQGLQRAMETDQLGVAQRGQDISSLNSIYGIDTGNQTAQRGQDIGAATSRYATEASAGTAQRGQDVSKYGIDIQAGEEARRLAVQQQMASQQALLGLARMY